MLAAILRQNPAFHAAMTSPVGSIYMAMENVMSRRNEAALFLTSEQRRGMLRSVFEAYYAPMSGRRVVFDTNRLWCARLAALSQLFPKAQVICCVRPVPWIIDSLEVQAQRNPFELSALFGFEPGSTIFTRAARVAASDGIVGYALDALREACFGPFHQRLILLDYETLTRAPERSIATLYALLGESPFDHDFSNVHYEAQAFDDSLGAAGLHSVNGPVRWQPRASVLPPELFTRYQSDAFWLRQNSRIAAIRKIMLHPDELQSAVNPFQ